MKLVLSDGLPTSASLARLIAVGWFCGFSTLALLPLTLFVLVGPIVAAVSDPNWMPRLPTLEHVIALVMFPLILAVQGLMVGAICAFGVWVYRRFRAIDVGAREPASSSAQQSVGADGGR
jgi:hypothetical protein